MILKQTSNKPQQFLPQYRMKFFTFFMFDCLSEIKIIGFETYLYFSYQPQFSLLLQAASETACWIVESLITVNGNTIMIMCLIKLIGTD